jgi:hypothetical protein
VSLGRSHPRQLYRVYDEDEFLAGALRPEDASDRAETKLAAGFYADPPRGDAEMEMAAPPLPSEARRQAARLRVILAAAVAAVVFVAIEMHASVGRITRPVPSRTPGLPGPRAARRSRRAARRLAVDARGASRAPGGAGPATTHQRELPLTPSNLHPGASNPEGAVAATAGSSTEFGFEQ